MKGSTDEVVDKTEKTLTSLLLQTTTKHQDKICWFNYVNWKVTWAINCWVTKIVQRNIFARKFLTTHGNEIEG